MRNSNFKNSVAKAGILPRRKSRRSHRLNRLGAESADLFGTLSAAQSLLQEFFQENELSLADVLVPAFGSNVDEAALTSLVAQIRAGDFSSLPTVEVRTAEELQDANGVYVAELDKIYVSSSFIATATSEELVALLLEEMGHAIDATINDSDSAGDEGNIFANLVLDVEMTEAQLATLHAEDDSRTLLIDGQLVEAEADIIDGDSQGNTLHGTANDDTMDGFNSDDTIYGYGGDDTIEGGKDNDTIYGGDGDDFIDGEENGDYLYGEQGNDTIYGGKSNDYIDGGEGDDFIDGEDGDDTIDGGDGNDVIYGDDDNDTIYGGDGDDYIDGGKNGDYLYGGEGNDTIYGGRSNDTIDGDAGNDILMGGDGADTINGGAGNDILRGGDDADTMDGGTGNDVIFTGDLSEGSSDNVTGGAGADTFFLGETTSSTTTTTNVSDFDFGSLALSLAGDATNIFYTSLGPTYNMTKAVVPIVFDGIKAMIGHDWSNAAVKTVEDLTEATHAEVKDFSALEDIVIVPLAESGDTNIYMTRSGRDILLKYHALGETMATLALDLTDEMDVFGMDASTDSFAEAYINQAIENIEKNALILNNNSVYLGYDAYDSTTDTSESLTNNIIDNLDSDFVTNELSEMSGRYMVFGAYAGQTIYDTSGYDYLFGTHQSDTFYGYLTSTAAPFEVGNHMAGYGGNDIFYAGGGTNFINGGDGTDSVSYEDANYGITIDLSVTADKEDDYGTYTYLGENGFYNSTYDTYGADYLYEVEGIIGSAYEDYITGDEKDNVFIGNAGNDILDGGDGSDTVSYAYLSDGQGVNINLGGGKTSISATAVTYYEGNVTNDAVESVVALDVNTATVGNNETDYLVNIEKIIGSNYDDTIIGGSEDNIFVGGNGNDTLDGGEGSDTVDYSYAESRVIAVLDGENFLGYTGGTVDSFSDRDTLTDIENIIGTNYDDYLIGNGESNIITGGKGNDDIDGNDGIDTVVFSGNFSDYTITNDGSGTYTVTDNLGTDGIDTLKEIEVLTFNDLSITVDADRVGFRSGTRMYMDTDFDGQSNFSKNYANSTFDEYLIGDWDGDGVDNYAARKGNQIYMDTNFDGTHDILQTYGLGNAEDQYLVGDWNGDGTDNIAVRRGNKIYMDTDFNSTHNILQTYGDISSVDEYLVGDWNGDRRDNIAVRQGNTIYMDTDFNSTHNILQTYGDISSVDEYLVGDWDGNGTDNLAIRLGSSFYMDTNFNNTHDILHTIDTAGLSVNQFTVGNWAYHSE